jgi:hypothetical protein
VGTEATAQAPRDEVALVHDPDYVRPVKIYDFPQAPVEDRIGFWDGQQYRPALFTFPDARLSDTG